MERTRVSWPDAEPARFDAELAAMASTAPDLVWNEQDLLWEGLVPTWPFDRPRPPQLDDFLGRQRLRVRVEYSQAFPMVAPRVVPVEPAPDPQVRTQQRWHVNGNGSLCLMQAASDWDGTATAADLVVKAAGWFLEYLLMEAGRIVTMSTAGIVNDASWDYLLAPEHELDDKP